MAFLDNNGVTRLWYNIINEINKIKTYCKEVVTTEGDGTAYTATVPSITSLTAGVSFIMIPHVVSASTTPTLDVNGLGAKNIKRRLSNLPTSLQSGYSNTWLAKGKPFRVTYDGTAWIVEGHEKPSAADLYGLSATITELNYCDGVTSNIQTQINSLKTAIVTDDTSGDKTITFTTSNVDSEFRYVCADGITSLTLDSTGTFSNTTEAYYFIVFLSGTTATTITNTLGAYFTGDDCDSGTFTPVASKTYEVGIWWNGLTWQGIIRGI